MDKKKLKKLNDKIINADNIKIALLFFPLLLLLITEIKSGEFSFRDYLDTGILVSVLLIFICNTIAYLIDKTIGRYCEDAVKLTTDYKKLSEKYHREKLITQNGIVFPVIELAGRTVNDPPFNITISQAHAANRYELPSQVADNADYLFKSHGHSIIYNSMNVRLDDLQVNGLDLTMTYSNTTYYDSLVTNRAMDYAWENGKTIREIYEPGPFLSPLAESKFSNHLGFNGFVETSDGKIIFVWRSGNLSIGKDTLADSIGASMKVKYCYNDAKQLTTETLHRAIRQEIHDELKITMDENTDFSASIFSFYRDLVEGGKPQFLFYVKLKTMTESAFKTNFKEILAKEEKEKKENKKKAVIDGEKFHFYSIDELKRSTITPGLLSTPDGKRFPIMPSASAAIVLLLRHLG